MAQSDANRSAIYVSKETTWGEVPASPSMTQLPFTAASLQHNKQTVSSQRVRSDRMRDTVAEVAASADGGLQFELSFADFDTIFEAALTANYVTVNITATNISASTTDDSFNRATGSFVTDGIVAGMYVKVSGFTHQANNGVFKVLTVAAAKITVEANLVTEAAGPSVTIKGKMLRNGTVEKSLLIEERYLDITQFISYRGMRVSQLDLSVTSQEIVTGSVEFVGKQAVGAGATVAGTSNGHSTNQVFNATANVGSLTEAGAALATAIKAIQLTLANNPRPRPAVGNKYPVGVGYGTLSITGTVEAYFEDLALYNKFVNHTSSSLHFRLTDDGGNVMCVTLPKLYFTSAPPAIPGIDQDIMLPLSFEAVRDAATNCEIQIDMLAA